jgi:hypothetical protein
MPQMERSFIHESLRNFGVPKNFLVECKMSVKNYKGNSHIFTNDSTGIIKIRPNDDEIIQMTGTLNLKANTDPDFYISEDDSAWVDVTSSVVTRDSGPSVPSYTTFTTGFYGYEMIGASTAKTIYEKFHIPHNYKPNSGCFIHCHIISGAGTNTSNNFQLTFSWIYADGSGVFTAPDSVSVLGKFENDYQHKIIEIPTAILPNTMEVDGIIICSITRDPNAANDTLAQSLWIVFSDVHIETTKLATKYRNKLTTGSFYG